MEILITHSLWGESVAATSRGVRKWPYGNNESHEAGTLISFQKKRGVGPSAGPKLMATLWSNSQRDSTRWMINWWKRFWCLFPFLFFVAVRVAGNLNYREEHSLIPSPDADELQLLRGGSAAAALSCSKNLGVMAEHKSSLCKGPSAQPGIGPLIKAAFPLPY